MTNLEKLNELLQNPKIKVPDYTRQVHETGKNQMWLRKVLSKNPDTPVEVARLLQLSMPELSKTYIV